MKIKKYKNLKSAIESVTKKDKECIFVRHSLKRGDKIGLHYHKKANEFIVVDKGKLKVILEGVERTFSIKDQAITIYLPKNKKHALLALSAISYFVLRDEKDDSIFVK